jgi:hypothetical protein
MPKRREDWREIAEKVLQGVASGDGLRATCREIGLHESSFLHWVRDDEELAKQYAHARDIGNEIEFEKLQALAEELPERTERGVDSGWVQWQRLRMDAARWALSKKRLRNTATGWSINIPGMSACKSTSRQMMSDVLAYLMCASLGACMGFVFASLLFISSDD